jgi:hypothetical protein
MVEIEIGKPEPKKSKPRIKKQEEMDELRNAVQELKSLLLETREGKTAHTPTGSVVSHITSFHPVGNIQPTVAQQHLSNVQPHQSISDHGTLSSKTESTGYEQAGSSNPFSAHPRPKKKFLFFNKNSTPIQTPKRVKILDPHTGKVILSSWEVISVKYCPECGIKLNKTKVKKIDGINKQWIKCPSFTCTFQRELSDEL